MSNRHGFTLLELLVVLVLVALAAALVAPSLLSPQRRSDDAVVSLIDASRRAAVARAGAVTLSVAADGHWQLAADGVETGSGNVSWPYAEPARIRINALGACTLEIIPGVTPSFTMDAARCRLRP